MAMPSSWGGCGAGGWERGRWCLACEDGLLDDPESRLLGGFDSRYSCVFIHASARDGAPLIAGLLPSLRCPLAAEGISAPTNSRPSVSGLLASPRTLRGPPNALSARTATRGRYHVVRARRRGAQDGADFPAVYLACFVDSISRA